MPFTGARAPVSPFLQRCYEEYRMKALLKIFLFFGLETATLAFAILMLMACFVWHPIGMFWYGMGLMASGASLNATIDWIGRDC